MSALCEIGETERAQQLCEKLLFLASPLDLYAEEIDLRTGRHMGNLPQAFTHLALIDAVIHVIQAQQQPEPAAPDRACPQPYSPGAGSGSRSASASRRVAAPGSASSAASRCRAGHLPAAQARPQARPPASAA